MSPLALARVLDDAQLILLHRLGQAAADHGSKLWAVGGIVRDAMLGNRVLDIDLTSETPAGKLGPMLAKETGGVFGHATRFGTGKLHIDGSTFDLATTRTEAYPKPAVLPVVRFGTMGDDLSRRDFTVNAMALSLAPTDFGSLLDPHDGQRDLNSHLIRALHSQSFRDDPTRAFRVVRYAVRLGFRIERRTGVWMRRDVRYIELLTPARVRHEIERILDEPRGANMLAEAHRRGLLAGVHPALGVPDVIDALRKAGRARLRGLAVIGVLLYPLSPDEAASVAHRLALSRKQIAVAQAVPRLRLSEPNIREATPSEVDGLVGNAPPEALQAMASVASDTQARQSLRAYLRRSAAPPWLNGRDLEALGIPQGPATGLALRSLRAAQLDGQVRSRAAAVTFVRKLAEE